MWNNNAGIRPSRSKPVMVRRVAPAGGFAWRYIREELLSGLICWLIVIGTVVLMLCIAAVESVFR